MEILREVDAGKTSKLEIAKNCILKSTLFTYINNKRAIEEAYATEAFASSRKRLRPAKHPELEHAVVTWDKGDGKPGHSPEWPDGHGEDFSTAEGWLHCFYDRHEIVFCTLLGKDVSSETCATWQNSAYLKAY
ncbi:hypothetical protein HPB49_008156 [Dermacentor silvarum]|uniref:Uncharacterized protein n=1 Tax=Dermacentor silvarum TaxID=543639 RepID=A0ACB8D3X9_DERSI|nr:hypothetical protein HPB49_008156 [Dermacentor silvarum]